jgi:HlyD family secretion protein
MNKKNVIVISSVIVFAVIAMIVFNKLTHKKDLSLLFSETKKTDFEIVVSTTGELQAENSLDIKGPEGLQSRNIRFGGIKIQDLIPEGTVVHEGDYIATLDRSDADNSFKEELDNQEKYETAMLKAVIDTTITLGDLRDEMVNLKFAVEEAGITLEESKYEPPTTIRQAQISLDKAKRSYQQAVTNYDLKVKQAVADVRDAQITLERQKRKVNEMRTVIDKFTITAPASGMVIYKREWDGSKREVGSQISAWDPVVATLPDLSAMISKTYVNEIDISKVKVGQKVRITVDAFPEKAYTGVVSSVANIGEQLPNTDAKVFEVITKVDGTDPILRPSMTTGNQIITRTFKNVLNIPLECVFATADSIPFVYTRSGARQVVVLGESNENNIIVEQGLKENEQIYLSKPAGGDKFRFSGNELISVIKERIKAKKAEEARQRQESERTKAMNEIDMPPVVRVIKKK